MVSRLLRVWFTSNLLGSNFWSLAKFSECGEAPSLGEMQMLLFLGKPYPKFM